MIYTDEFLLLLNDIHKNKPCVVSKYLTENTDVKDITFISIEGDMITFVMQDKLDIILLDKCVNKKLLEDENSLMCHFINQKIKSKELRLTKIKIGRFLKKIHNFTALEMQNFTDKFKGFIKLKTETSRFSIVDGEDIRKYYSEDNFCYKKGQLGESCMRYRKCQEYLNIYVENPDICKLLILKGYNTDNIVGRAIIWTLDDGRKYLDRVYTNLDSDMPFFEEYAKTLGCFTSYSIINYSHKYIELKIKPKNRKFEMYPYMDTFRYYYPKKRIFSYEIIIGNNNYHLLEKDDGILPIMASKEKKKNETNATTEELIP